MDVSRRSKTCLRSTGSLNKFGGGKWLIDRVSLITISFPNTGGALKGIGEKFSPDLHTGADCSSWMRDTGFRETYVEHLVGPDSTVVGIKYRVDSGTSAEPNATASVVLRLEKLGLTPVAYASETSHRRVLRGSGPPFAHYSVYYNCCSSPP
jgi:hypothetical protein